MGTDNGSIRAGVPRSRLRTVLIVRNAYDWQYGGAEQFSLNFARSLKAEGIGAVVVTNVPDLVSQCRAEGIPCQTNLWLQNETHRRWAPVYYLLYPVLILQYAYWIMRYRASLIMLGSRDDQIFGTLAALLTGRPAVWVDHADMKGVIAQPFRFLRKSYFWAMSRARAVVAVSQAEREKIFANLPERYRTHFQVINNGAVLVPDTPFDRPAKGKVVTFVGRIELDKGAYDLMAAIPEILKVHPDTHFWLVGKGQAEPDFRTWIDEHDAAENVRLVGHLTHVSQALLPADIFVYPTHHDASPLANVEAMQAGLPVVATRIGGIPEVVIDGECGILVESKQPAALAAAVVKLLDDEPLRKRLAAAALKQGRKYEFGRVVHDHYLPLFEEVLR